MVARTEFFFSFSDQKPEYVSPPTANDFSFQLWLQPKTI